MERAAYLRALGIDQWKPRAAAVSDESLVTQTTNDSVALAAEQSDRSATPATDITSAQPKDSVDGAPPALEETPKKLIIPGREYLQDDLMHDALVLASLHWKVLPQQHTQLAVLGIDASTSQLKPGDFEQDWAVLQKMLAAIGQDIEQCAVGALQWGESATQQLDVPYALLLVDSGEDHAALIHYWQEKLLTVKGARAVIAPHPCMFAQGTALKRQAWSSLQMLQQLWTD